MISKIKRGFGFLGDICVNSKLNWKSPKRIYFFIKHNEKLTMSLPPMAYCDSKAKETIKNHIKGDRFSILLNGIFHKSTQKR